MIGIFDSGLGGLTVARAIMRELPNEKVVYMGDTARGPYGNRAPGEITRFSFENTKFLLKKRARTIVVGCNTASAVAGLWLKRVFPGVPIIDVVTPAVREAIRVSRNGRIGIIGTRTTIQSGAYQKWLPQCNTRACPMFVPLVEGGYAEHPSAREIARHYLLPLKTLKCDTLILGCTHYPFMKTTIERIMGPRVRLVDSAETVAAEIASARVHEFTNIRKLANSKTRKFDMMPRHEFYVSKKTPRFQELAEQWLGQKIALREIRIKPGKD